MIKTLKKLLPLIMTFILILSISACKPKDEDIEPSVDAAEDLIDDGELDDAIDMLEDLIDDDDMDIEAWELLIEAYIEDESFEDAAEALSDLGDILKAHHADDDDDVDDATEMYKDFADELAEEDEDLEITSIDDIIGIEEAPAIEPNEPEVTEPEDMGDGEGEDPEEPDNGGDEGHEGEYTSGDITLTDGELKTEFYADGSILTVNNMAAADFTSNFGLDMYADYDDIKTAVESLFSMSGATAELIDFRPMDNTAVLTIEIAQLDALFLAFNSFEDMLAFSGLESYEALLNDTPFVNYQTKESLSASEFITYQSNFSIIVGTDPYGAYFTFPSDILIVSDMNYQVIDERTIYLEGGSSGVIVLEEALSLPDTDSNNTNTGDHTEVYPIDGLEIGLDQGYINFAEDGSCNMALNVTEAGLVEFMGLDFSSGDEAVVSTIEMGIQMTGIMELLYIEKNPDNLILELGMTNIADLMSDSLYASFNDLKTEFDSNEDILTVYPLEHYASGQSASANDLNQFEGFAAMMNVTTDNGEFYTFPHKIVLADEDLNYTKIDDYTIFIPDGGLGLIVIDGPINY